LKFLNLKAKKYFYGVVIAKLLEKRVPGIVHARA